VETLPVLSLVYGGLNQIMGFRRLVLLGRFSHVCCWNLSSWLYPLFFRASWYNGVHSAKLVVSDEISHSPIFRLCHCVYKIKNGCCKYDKVRSC